jgi:8-oxo-dGTP pyrophosphatase MutT (NUDIX family)
MPAWISLNRDGLALVGGPQAYSFPAGPDLAAVRLSFPEAVHARIFPAVTAERVLAAWSRGALLSEWAPEVDPRYDRRRGAAVVLSGDRILLIRYAPAVRDGYFIPGGSVEAGETPAEAAIRELKEETGLSGTVVRPLATVLNRSREEHYHLVSTEDREPRPLDLAPGQTLEWVPLEVLATTPVWPKRLAWRISWWAGQGWPDPPPVLADANRDLHSRCDW